MKKYVLIVVLFGVTTLLAQKKVAEKVSELQSLNANFIPFSVLSPNPDVINSDVNRVVEGATLATLQLDKINEIVSNRFDYLELQIPYQNKEIFVLLYRVNPFLEGFHIDTDQNQNIAYQKGIHYRGIIKGNTNSLVSFNFFKGECNGIVSSAELGNLVVGKIDKRGNQTEYIVYSDSKMNVLNPFECHAKDSGFVPQKGESNKQNGSLKCVALYFEIDNDVYVNNESSTTATGNWMTSVFNNMQTIFSNDGIFIGLKTIYIWTSADPYNDVGTSSVDYLIKFAQTRSVFDGDVGQLIGIDPGGLGGVAFLDTLCSEYNYGYSDVTLAYAEVPVYSWTINVITHELGHSLGSPHTHRCFWNGNNTAIDGCGPTYNSDYSEGSCETGPLPTAEEKGTIMSYCHLLSGIGINFANGFGPQPKSLILNNVNSKNCLSADCASSCSNTVVGLTVSAVTTDTAVITWDDLGNATSWQIAVTPYPSTTKTWHTVTQKSYAVSELSPNTYYKISIKPVCIDVETIVREKTFATNAADYCAGVPFNDTGSVNSNYSDAENWVRTMMPSNPDFKISVTFSSFNLEKDYDYLYIYNGNSEQSEDLTNGGLTGDVLPAAYTSTAPDGSLTFRFVSDEATIAPGWTAIITCSNSLGIQSGDFLDFSYSPNPTNGYVVINSKKSMQEIAVYNIEGRLLHVQKGNDFKATVDMLPFATGTYFFKVKLGDRNATFKVLKI